MSNYPIGAKDDPRAPYNEELSETREYYTSIVLSCPKNLQVLKSCPKDRAVEKVKEELSKELKPLTDKDWNIDEMVVIEE